MTTPDDLDALAAEYVLGLVGDADERRIDRLVASDPSFAARVEEWRLRLLPLDDTARAEPAGDGLWSRIESSTAVPVPPAKSRAAWRDAAWWNSLALWRGVGMAGAVSTILLAIGLATFLLRETRRPVLVAVLTTDTNRPAALVNVYRGGETRLLPLEDINVPPGRILEVWTLWDRAVGPRSIGRFDRATAAALRLDSLPLGPNQLFEITLEPEGGSPIGRPTGPILMKGTTSNAL